MSDMKNDVMHYVYNRYGRGRVPMEGFAQYFLGQYEAQTNTRHWTIHHPEFITFAKRVVEDFMKIREEK